MKKLRKRKTLNKRGGLFNGKGFTLIELIVVIAIIGILVLLAAPKLLSYTEEAKLAQIKNDSKVVEDAVHLYMVDNGDQLPEGVGVYLPEDLDTALGEIRVFNSKGVALEVAGGDYFDMTEDAVVSGVKSKLDGKFIANDGGDVYYIHSESMGVDGGVSTEDDLYRGMTIAAGSYHTLALTEGGELYSWGLNTDGQLGYSGNNQTIPKQVEDLKNVKAVTAGERHSLAITEDGKLFSWGMNVYGRTGLGTILGNQTTPKEVEIEDESGNALKVTAVTAGHSHSLALTESGEMFSWGRNNNSQLGDGSTTNRNTPVEVKNGAIPAGTRIRTISAGGIHSLAITEDGNLFSWGYNTDGTNQTTPEKVEIKDKDGSALKVTVVTAGLYHSLAITEDGCLFSWGSNGHGRTGLGTILGNQIAPEKVEIKDKNGNLLSVRAVTAGNIHSLAITEDGRLFSWGSNIDGQLGYDTGGSNQTTPEEVTGIENVKAITAGGYHSLVITKDGRLFSWGRNNDGQLGRGGTTTSSGEVTLIE